eukprot:PhF_6_TR14415/c0_g1_i1/m.23008
MPMILLLAFVAFACANAATQPTGGLSPVYSGNYCSEGSLSNAVVFAENPGVRYYTTNCNFSDWNRFNVQGTPTGASDSITVIVEYSSVVGVLELLLFTYTEAQFMAP